MPLPPSFITDVLIDQDVTLPVAGHHAAFIALKALWDDDTTAVPTSDDPFTVARALQHLLAQHGWVSDLSGMGNLVGLTHPSSLQARRLAFTSFDADRVYRALAPFVEEGSYLSFEHPRDPEQAWSVVFNGHGFVVEDDTMTLPEAFSINHAWPFNQASASRSR